ncbi:hypothetical protein ABFV54_27555, partial [Pseudomonas syringae]|uniref:hypothetical protein n=1 Tax=Pseudomonas syringae TaxID=317 RepID=UPI0034D5F98F
ATTAPTEPKPPVTQEKVKPIAQTPKQIEAVVETQKVDIPTAKTSSTPIVESKEASPIEPVVEVSNNSTESKSERKKKFQNVFSNIEK